MLPGYSQSVSTQLYNSYKFPINRFPFNPNPGQFSANCTHYTLGGSYYSPFSDSLKKSGFYKGYVFPSHVSLPQALVQQPSLTPPLSSLPQQVASTKKKETTQTSEQKPVPKSNLKATRKPRPSRRYMDFLFIYTKYLMVPPLLLSSTSLSIRFRKNGYSCKKQKISTQKERVLF